MAVKEYRATKRISIVVREKTEVADPVAPKNISVVSKILRLKVGETYTPANEGETAVLNELEAKKAGIVKVQGQSSYIATKNVAIVLREPTYIDNPYIRKLPNVPAKQISLVAGEVYSTEDTGEQAILDEYVDKHEALVNNEITPAPVNLTVETKDLEPWIQVLAWEGGEDGDEDDLYEVWKKVGDGAYALIHTTEAGILEYEDNIGETHSETKYKVKALCHDVGGAFSSEVTVDAYTMLAPILDSVEDVVGAEWNHLVTMSTELESPETTREFKVFRQTPANGWELGEFLDMSGWVAGPTYTDAGIGINHGEVTYKIKSRNANLEESGFSNLIVVPANP